MIMDGFKWELFSGDGQTKVLARRESTSDSLKCVEDPFNPESEALESLSGSLANLALLILPPCSARTINAIKDAAPELKIILVVDCDTERLNVWREGVGCDLEACETLELPQDFKLAEEVLRERLMQFECELFLGACSVYIPSRYKRLDKDFSEFLYNRVLFLQRESCSAAATRSMWAWRRTLNQLLNAGERSVHKITGTAKDERPSAVVIVGAGPSLDINIDQLKQYADRAIIIATDAAVNTMLEHGVTPNLVASMDSGPLMWRLFVKNIDKLKDVPLAASLDLNHSVYKKYPGKLLAYEDKREDAPCDFGLPKLPHGQCVGHFAFHLAESLTPKNIVMVGFDLAYREGKFHTAGMQCKYESDFKKSFEGTSSYVDAADGGKVKTDLSLEFFLKYFERAIASCNCTVIDATEGGAFKRGAKVSSLRAALSTLPPAPQLLVALNDSYDPAKSALGVASLREGLGRLAGRLAKAKVEAEGMTPDKVHNPLKDIDLLSKEFKLVSTCANFLLMVKWVDVLKNYKQENFGTFKSTLLSLSDDLNVCAETLEAALSAASQSWTRDSSHCIALIPKGGDQELVHSLLQRLAPDALPFPADTPLHVLWREAVRSHVGRILCFNGNSSPELWSVPELRCDDVKTEFKPSPHDKTLWLPGYRLLAATQETFSQWRNFAPADVDCQQLHEGVPTSA